MISLMIDSRQGKAFPSTTIMNRQRRAHYGRTVGSTAADRTAESRSASPQKFGAYPATPELAAAANLPEMEPDCVLRSLASAASISDSPSEKPLRLRALYLVKPGGQVSVKRTPFSTHIQVSTYLLVQSNPTAKIPKKQMGKLLKHCLLM